MAEGVRIERCVVAAYSCATVASVVAPGLAALSSRALGSEAHPGVVASVVATAAAVIAVAPVARRLPAALDGASRRRPRTAALWVLLALISLVQIGRLSVFIDGRASAVFAPETFADYTRVSRMQPGWLQLVNASPVSGPPGSVRGTRLVSALTTPAIAPPP